MTVWPAPIVKLFMNQMMPAAVLAAADDPDPAKKNGQTCEANFYSGELSLTKGSKDEAIRLFRWRQAIARTVSTNGMPPMLN
jgi:lipoprotein NlpI